MCLAKLDFCNILDHFVFFLPRSTFWATLGFGLIFDFTLCAEHFAYITIIVSRSTCIFSFLYFGIFHTFLVMLQAE
jgi:hypothetical protein